MASTVAAIPGTPHKAHVPRRDIHLEELAFAQ
jgi:hypothetical protein